MGNVELKLLFPLDMFKDKHGKELRTGNTVLFQHLDTQEPGGVNKRVLDVQLCFWCKNEKRYIPFTEVYDAGKLEEVEIITNSVKQRIDE